VKYVYTKKAETDGIANEGHDVKDDADIVYLIAHSYAKYPGTADPTENPVINDDPAELPPPPPPPAPIVHDASMTGRGRKR